MLAFLGIPSASSIAKDLVRYAIDLVASLLASGVENLLKALFGFIGATTDPLFSTSWWRGAGSGILSDTLQIAGMIVVLALVLAAFEGIWTGSTTPIVKALAALPGAFLKTASLLPVTALLVSGTDQVADLFDGSIVEHLGAAPVGLAAAIAGTDVVGMIVALVIIGAVLALWAELAIRASMIYLVVMTAPMVIMASVHPRLRQSWTKLAELGIALIVSKVLVALALAVGFSQLTSVPASPSFTQGVAALVDGIATLAIACFSPFVLFRLISAEVAQFEGLARRPVRAALQVSTYQQGLSSFLNRFGNG
jgi:hypothetical protein